MAEIIKRIGPAGYWCRRCAHCNSVELGCIDDVPIYTCSNPYNGVEKEVPGDENITCTMFKLADKGRYPWGSDEDKVLKYCANDVVIIAEQMARERQKELEDKVEKYEKLLIDILNETYNHPQLFEHNIHAYELIPGHIKFLRNSFNTMCDKYDPVFEENTKLKEEKDILNIKIDEYEKMLLDIYSIFHPYPAKTKNLTLEKAFRRLPEKVKTKVETYKDDLTKYQYALGEKSEEARRLQWRNDNQSKMIQDLKKERDELKNELDKYKESDDIYFTTTQVKHMMKSVQSVIIGEKDKKISELEARRTYWEKKALENAADLQKAKKDRDKWRELYNSLSEICSDYDKRCKEECEKNRELQIRVNDLLFQEKLNKSAFGYDYEEENGKLRVENERLRNMVKSQRNCSSSYYYSALKAEDKIEHIQKEAKKWKNKYKEAYDILETYFKYDLDGMEFDVSYDDINLTLRYSTPNGDKGKEYKYNALVSAYERLKKL